VNEVSFSVGAATDVGKVREVNEDAHGFARCSAGDLLVVCDGMGGHASGDVASREARDAVIRSVTAGGAENPAGLLHQAILAAHHRVRELAAASPERQGMGTTVVAALVYRQRATVANIGDSRAYVVRSGEAQQVSKDHTKGQQLLDGGLITTEQLANHPQKGVLYQALGQTASEPAPHVVQFELVPGDYLVLCSDGVYDCLGPTDLAELTSGANPNYAADTLVRHAVERDGKDNATVVIGRRFDPDGVVASAKPALPDVPPRQEPAVSATASADPADDRNAADARNRAWGPRAASTLPAQRSTARAWLALVPYLLAAFAFGVGVGWLAFRTGPSEQERPGERGDHRETPANRTEFAQPPPTSRTDEPPTVNIAEHPPLSAPDAATSPPDSRQPPKPAQPAKGKKPTDAGRSTKLAADATPPTK
jgi:protein phosphatase